MKYKIDTNACIGCGGCSFTCPAMAISNDPANPPKFRIDPDKCAGCGVCAGSCPIGAISADEVK